MEAAVLDIDEEGAVPVPQLGGLVGHAPPAIGQRLQDEVGHRLAGDLYRLEGVPLDRSAIPGLRANVAGADLTAERAGEEERHAADPRHLAIGSGHSVLDALAQVVRVVARELVVPRPPVLRMRGEVHQRRDGRGVVGGVDEAHDARFVVDDVGVPHVAHVALHPAGLIPEPEGGVLHVGGRHRLEGVAHGAGCGLSNPGDVLGVHAGRRLIAAIDAQGVRTLMGVAGHDAHVVDLRVREELADARDVVVEEGEGVHRDHRDGHVAIAHHHRPRPLGIVDPGRGPGRAEARDEDRVEHAVAVRVEVLVLPRVVVSVAVDVERHHVDGLVEHRGDVAHGRADLQGTVAPDRAPLAARAVAVGLEGRRWAHVRGTGVLRAHAEVLGGAQVHARVVATVVVAAPREQARGEQERSHPSPSRHPHPVCVPVCVCTAPHRSAQSGRGTPTIPGLLEAGLTTPCSGSPLRVDPPLAADERTSRGLVGLDGGEACG